jgi:hypothetical protein
MKASLFPCANPVILKPKKILKDSNFKKSQKKKKKTNEKGLKGSPFA